MFGLLGANFRRVIRWSRPSPACFRLRRLAFRADAALGALLLIWALIALTVIDFDTQLLPDDITLPLLWLGLCFNLVRHLHRPPLRR